MSATKADIQRIEQEVRNHKEETKEIISSLKDLPVAITKLSTSIDHHCNNVNRLERVQIEMGKTLKSIEIDNGTLKNKIENLTKTQGGILGFGYKVALLVLSAAITGLSAVIFLKG